MDKNDEKDDLMNQNPKSQQDDTPAEDIPEWLKGLDHDRPDESEQTPNKKEVKASWLPEIPDDPSDELDSLDQPESTRPDQPQPEPTISDPSSEGLSLNDLIDEDDFEFGFKPEETSPSLDDVTDSEGFIDLSDMETTQIPKQSLPIINDNEEETILEGDLPDWLKEMIAEQEEALTDDLSTQDEDLETIDMAKIQSIDHSPARSDLFQPEENLITEDPMSDNANQEEIDDLFSDLDIIANEEILSDQEWVPEVSTTPVGEDEPLVDEATEPFGIQTETEEDVINLSEIDSSINDVVGSPDEGAIDFSEDEDKQQFETSSSMDYETAALIANDETSPVKVSIDREEEESAEGDDLFNELELEEPQIINIEEIVEDKSSPTEEYADEALSLEKPVDPGNELSSDQELASEPVETFIESDISEFDEENLSSLEQDLQQGQFNQAIPTIKKLMADSNQIDELESLIKQATEGSEKHNSNAWELLGDISKQHNKPDEAFLSYTKAIKCLLNPEKDDDEVR